MNDLFVAANALVALGDPTDVHHQAAVEFVTELFNETVRVFTSGIEVMLAVDEVNLRLGVGAAEKLLGLLRDGGVLVLPVGGVEDLAGLRQRFYTAQTKAKLTYSQSILLETLVQYQLRNLFTFDTELSKFNVIVYPKSTLPLAD